ncbi:hypothetical protein [Pseudonocardia sp.]|uniref:hypothetical protein n=1 Tax=Pseudonocardia sp. TaxID=60912 RepID=UPI0031FCA80A
MLQDAIDVYAAKQPVPVLSVHVMTGRVRARVPYGVNRTGPSFDVLPALLKQSSTTTTTIDLAS